MIYCYEPDFERIYTEAEIESLYQTLIDKSEYPDLESWISDMLKSVIFVKDSGSTKKSDQESL